jgi:hypothetical protein
LNGSWEIVGDLTLVGDELKPTFYNHIFQNETDYLYGIALQPYGIYEFNLTMTTSRDVSHPIHIHVNHFQIVGEYVRNEDATYTSDGSENIVALYRIGEHRDTVMSYSNRVLQVRFSTFGYTGAVVIHCHYLTHSDLGMMATIPVSDGVNDQGLQNDEAHREQMDQVQNV